MGKKIIETRVINSIKGLIFDFDGLLIDTETPAFKAWKQIYREFNCNLPLTPYLNRIGSGDMFDPIKFLEEMLQSPLPHDRVREKHQKLLNSFLETETILPGVLEYIKTARKNNIKLAIASNSYISWVLKHLRKFNVIEYFDCIKCRDHVFKRKPDPEIYTSILKDLTLKSNEVIAFEDSNNGIISAEKAGIFCVAVPNRLNKKYLDSTIYSLKINSLEDISLNALIQLVKSA